jgi:hypothetical protein
MIGHQFLGHDLPAALVSDLLQQLAQPAGHRPPRIPQRYFGHHTACKPSDDTPPEVRQNRRGNTPRTLRNDTDNHPMPHCSPARIPPTAKAADPLRAHL